MTYTVVALQAEPRKRNRVRVRLEPDAPLVLDRRLAAALQIGQRLSELELEGLQQADEVEQTVQWAVRQTTRRPHSEAEIRQRMNRKRLAPEVQADALSRLKADGWLDDQKFASFWVENRDTFRPRGARALRAELRRKGVRSEAIEAALQAHDDAAAALAAGRKAARRWKGAEASTFEQHVVAYLMRRGFDYSTGASTARLLWEEAGERGEENSR